LRCGLVCRLLFGMGCRLRLGSRQTGGGEPEMGSLDAWSDVCVLRYQRVTVFVVTPPTELVEVVERVEVVTVSGDIHTR
jgi:hypothetical protein